MSRVANFCPSCGAPVVQKERYGRLRPVCTACDFTIFHDPKVAVLAFITNDDKVLLVKRAINPGAGKWACPAGFVEYDEAPADAVLRELKEETGLIGKIDGLLEVFPKKDDGLANIVIAYHITVVGGELQADDDAEAVGWFSRETIPELVFFPSITLVGRWCDGEL